MMTNFQNVDEYGRREFIAHAAKACLGVGLMPMAGSYIHDSVKALTPGARPSCSTPCHLPQHDWCYVSLGHFRPANRQP